MAIPKEVSERIPNQPPELFTRPEGPLVATLLVSHTFFADTMLPYYGVRVDQYGQFWDVSRQRFGQDYNTITSRAWVTHEEQKGDTWRSFEIAIGKTIPIIWIKDDRGLTIRDNTIGTLTVHAMYREGELSEFAPPPGTAVTPVTPEPDFLDIEYNGLQSQRVQIDYSTGKGRGLWVSEIGRSHDPSKEERDIFELAKGLLGDRDTTVSQVNRLIREKTAGRPWPPG